jgi:hypothetical protein
VRRIAGAVLICVMLAAQPAGAATPSLKPTPSLKRQYAPLNNRIQTIGEDAGAALSASSAWTYAKREAQFSSLAHRTTAVSQAVAAMRGAHGTFLVRQRKLAKALAKGAADLAAIAAADRQHSAAKETAASSDLVRDSPAINDLRSSLSKPLGLGS